MEKKKKKLSLTSWIIIGLILGVITGLLFGDACAKLKIIGEVFIQLLQMTILPYIITSLIAGIGGLSFTEARDLALRGGILLFLFWGAILAVTLVMPLVFPEIQSASFFSTSQVAIPQPDDYLSLYIPANPFSSLANSMIPAVVLFGICIGVALIGIDDKKPLLDVLRIARDALTKVAKAVVYLTPIGVFAFAANAAGTLTIEQIGQLQVFFITFILVSIILTFLVFPLLVTSLTPFKYKDVLSISKDVLVTSFTTGNLFIVLPLITDRVKQLLATREEYGDDNQDLPDVIIPVTFNFPDAGQLSSVLFILFCTWFAGTPLSLMRYPDLAISGLLSFFGGSNLAIPYLLKHYKLSMDYFNLYIIAGIVNGYFATMAAAMHLIAFTIICAYSMSHGIKISLRRIVINFTIAAVATGVLLGATKIYLSKTVNTQMSQAYILDGMKLKNPLPMTVVKTPIPKARLEGSPITGDRLAKIKKEKVLKVGYNPNTMPFAFFNKKDELIGYDVQMANDLARDLGCEKVEFIKINFENIDKALEVGVVDIVMTGIYVNLRKIADMDFTTPYMEIHPAIIVKDYRKDEFSTVAKIRKMDPKPHIGILKGSAFKKAAEVAFGTELVEIDSYVDFFEGNKYKLDGVINSAEQGSTWALLYPSYDTVILKDVKHTTFVAYAIAKGDLPFLEYLNYWVKLQKLNKATGEYYSYWVLGKVPELKKPRWCVMRNVLHWME
jgi:Na+/H+-dicarboxylate symporter